MAESLAELGPFQLLLAPPIGWVFAVVFGALWGSFFNVAIHRLAQEDAKLRDVMWPPSHCPRCKSQIRARDNLPVLGWLLLRGKCRDCALPIPIRYPLVEALGGVLGGLVYLVFVLGVPDGTAAMYGRFFVYFFFGGTLLVLAFIDLDTMLLPEVITLPAIPTFFVLGRLIHDVPLVDALIGAAVGFGALKGLQIGYAMITGREGLGGGDATLMALIGGFLGWRALPFTLGLGSTIGTIVTIPILILQRRRAAADAAMHKNDVAAQQAEVAVQPEAPATPGPGEGEPGAEAQDEEQTEPSSIRHVEVPFGPFLVAGALLYMFLKDPFWQWLMSMADAT